MIKKINVLLLLITFFITSVSYAMDNIVENEVVSKLIPQSFRKFSNLIKHEQLDIFIDEWEICDEDVFCEYENNVISKKTSKPVTGIVVKLGGSNRSKDVIWKCNYVEGKRNGLYKKYYNGNSIQEIKYYVDGIAQGHFKLYKRAGTYAEGTYVNGKRDGPYKEFYSNGNILYDSIYRDGSLIKQKVYSKEGKLMHTLNEKEIKNYLKSFNKRTLRGL